MSTRTIRLSSAFIFSLGALLGCDPGWDGAGPEQVTDWYSNGAGGGGSEVEQEDDGTGMEEPLRGLVRDPQGLRVHGVAVWVDGEHVATTDRSGRFALPDVQDGQRVVMGFHKTGYASTWGSYVPTEGGQNYFTQTLAPVDLTMQFDAQRGASFEIDGTHRFDLPADTILTADGEVYEGRVFLQGTVWDRATPLDEGGEFLASPGDGQGTTEDGQSHLLYTYGMFQLQLEGEDGEVLQAGQGTRVEVELPETANRSEGEEVPFWELDAEEDTWVEAGQGQISEIEAGQQVWEYEPTQGLPARTQTIEQVVRPSSCNPDDIITQVAQSGQATGTVTDQQGQPMSGAQVRVISQDQTYMITTQTDDQGQFAVTVPPQVANPVGPNGQPIFVEVDYEQGQQPFLWRQNPLAPPAPGGTTDFGTIDTGSVTCVVGTVRSPQGAPVADVPVTTSHGGNAVSDAAGGFCLQVPKWQPASVYAVPGIGHEYGYQPARIRAEGDGGSCATSCTNVVELEAFAATSCVEGSVTIGGAPAERLRVEAFDPRFPTAPVFSTMVEGGTYSLDVPAGMDVTLRVGAGDLDGSNECASQRIRTRSDSGCVTAAPMVCE